MTLPMAPGVNQFDQAYRDTLQTLSDGSVHRSFDPYLDIDWDAPEFAIDPDDRRWVLSTEFDPLGATQFQIEVAILGVTCTVGV